MKLLFVWGFFRIIITRVFKSKDNLEIRNFFLSNYISSKWSLNSASEQCVHLKHTMHMCFIDSGNVGGIIFILLFSLGEPDVWNASSSPRARSVPPCFGRNMFDTPRTPKWAQSSEECTHTHRLQGVKAEHWIHTSNMVLGQMYSTKNSVWIQLINSVMTTSKHRFCAPF